MAILNIVREQASFNFTGKVNLLLKENGRFVGSIFLKDGIIVNCFLGQFEGYDALICLIHYDFLEGHICKYIVEPEIIDEFNQCFRVNIDTIPKIWATFKQEYESCLKLKPSLNLKIRVKPSFLEKNIQINNNEIYILKLISDYPLIDDVYKNSNIPEYLVTICLVNLRKKDSLIVCKNN